MTRWQKRDRRRAGARNTVWFRYVLERPCGGRYELRRVHGGSFHWELFRVEASGSEQRLGRVAKLRDAKLTVEAHVQIEHAGAVMRRAATSL